MMTATPYDSLSEALALYCKHLLRPASAESLRRGDVGTQGALTDRVTGMMAAQGLAARVVWLPFDQLTSAALPALIRRQDGHWRVVLTRDSDTMTLLAPESGGSEIVAPVSDVMAQFEGTVILARPQHRAAEWTGRFMEADDAHWFWSVITRYWPVFMEVGVAALVANALAIAIALFAMQVYDRVIPSSAFDTLWVLTVGVLLAIVLESVIRLVRSTLLESTGKRLDHHLGRRLFEQSIRLRLESRPATPGVMATQIREFESVREFFTATSAALVSDLPFVVLFLGVIALIGGHLVWVPVAALGLLLAPGLILQPWLSRLSRQGLQESAYKNSLLLEAFEGLESVKAASGEQRLINLWGEMHDTLSDTAFRLRRITQGLSQWSAMIQQLTYVGVVVVGAYLIDAGAMSVGGLVACTILVSRTVAPLGQIMGVLSRWQHVKAALKSLDGLMAAPTERPGTRRFVERPDLVGAYRFDHLQWQCGENAPLLLDIDHLNIAAGDRIALLGANGAGKSTLLKIMAGLVSPSAGQLLLQDTNLEHIDPVDKRRRIAYLPQDVTLFHATLRENINPSNRMIEDTDILALLDAIGLGGYVRAQPLGLDTLIQSNRSVSGGQRQLIGLARVLVQDPAIILLDEPTAALDQKTESSVMSFLQTWLTGRTLIVATHKRALLDITDRVLVLRNGKVFMDGPRSQIDAGGRQAPSTQGAAS